MLTPALSRLAKYAAARRDAAGRDNVRLPLQTVAAVVMASALMNWQALPEVAWGAFSALFVVRASVEGTITEAGARILGAILGVALGVALVLLSVAVALPLQWAIVGGVGAAAYISMRRPALSYSLVTVTILTVAPDSDVLSGAMNKTLAIIIGSACGILAALAVLPLSARRSMRTNLAESIEIYGDLLVEWASALNQGRRRPQPDERPAMAWARWRASDMACQSRAFPMNAMSRDAGAYRLNDRIEGLWRTVPLMERVGTIVLTDNICRRLGPALEGVATAAKEQIGELARALRAGDAQPPLCRTGTPFAALRKVVDEAVQIGAFNAVERQAVEVIRWTWHEVTQELDGLCESMEPEVAQ